MIQKEFPTFPTMHAEEMIFRPLLAGVCPQWPQFVKDSFSYKIDFQSPSEISQMTQAMLHFPQQVNARVKLMECPYKRLCRAV